MTTTTTLAITGRLLLVTLPVGRVEELPLVGAAGGDSATCIAIAPATAPGGQKRAVQLIICTAAIHEHFDAAATGWHSDLL